MLNLQEWIEKQWPSTMFFDPRIRRKSAIYEKLQTDLEIKVLLV